MRWAGWVTVAAFVLSCSDDGPAVDPSAGNENGSEAGSSSTASTTIDEPGDFIIHADRPIAVVNYMTGSSLAGSQGDPAMVQLPPVEQFLPRYVVLVPTSWTTDVITLMRTPGAEIVLDGVAVDDNAFVPVGTHEVARLPTTDGVHVMESDVAFGVLVTGYTTVDSYSYAGGLGTGVINPRPEG